APARAVLHHAEHERAHLLGDVAGGHAHWLARRSAGQESGAVTDPARGDRLGDRGELERGGEHLALTDCGGAQRQLRADRLGGGNRARQRARDRGLLVEAITLGGAHEPARADLHAEWREHGVARLGEALRERASAELAVGVLEIDAVDHGLLLDRPTGVPAGNPRANTRSRSPGVVGSPMDPAIDCATAPAGYTRASAGPDAIVFPPRASIFARRGATVVRSSLAPRGTPGNTRL